MKIHFDCKESKLYSPLSFVLVSPHSTLPPQLVDKKDDSPMEDDMNAEAVSAECDSHYFDDLSSLHLRWESESKESLGLLWFQLLRFYTVEFEARERVISLKQRNVMERGKERPGNRLALERKYAHTHAHTQHTVQMTSLYGVLSLFALSIPSIVHVCLMSSCCLCTSVTICTYVQCVT